MSIELAEQPLYGRATVEIELDREEWYQLMMMAHERDITLNQMVEQVLREAIAQYDQTKPETL
jgi:predicted HicB family RNase H-like nuclease